MNISCELEKMPNKKFVYGCLLLLINEGKLSISEIKILTNSEECKKNFMCTKFAILKEIPENCSQKDLEETCFDEYGRQRYYQETVRINEKSYVVSNHWYGPNKSNPDNRTPFLSWVMNLLSE